MTAREEITADVKDLVDTLGEEVDRKSEAYEDLNMKHGRKDPRTITAWDQYETAYKKYQRAYTAWENVKRS